ncbi:uncharacterized protein BDV17DRAFT_267509, partial [Aspergillus undulatus]|uniref:uncharacterized protein n=1 Tax=Aspergillus undulatus TaxID=1810928 RepID=UPI003CCCB3C0
MVALPGQLLSVQVIVYMVVRNFGAISNVDILENNLVHRAHPLDCQRRTGHEQAIGNRTLSQIVSNELLHDGSALTDVAGSRLVVVNGRLTHVEPSTVSLGHLHQRAAEVQGIGTDSVARVEAALVAVELALVSGAGLFLAFIALSLAVVTGWGSVDLVVSRFVARGVGAAGSCTSLQSCRDSHLTPLSCLVRVDGLAVALLMSAAATVEARAMRTMVLNVCLLLSERLINGAAKNIQTRGRRLL